ncbi:MAG: NYN domain-containing protein [Candidatus Krumholzibacteriota bacterium]|nr:NYN domain-containing protein [Candidatus Krumholzibacteriota bacterium]
MKAAILIDGAYLEMLMIKEHNRAQVDYHKLAIGLIKKVSRNIGSHVELLRTYYYHALPWSSQDPTEEEHERVQKKRGFFHRLEYLPRFTVKLGRTQRVLNDDGSTTYQQKGVDVMLAADMVYLAARGLVDHIILLAPDADYVPAVSLVKDMGVVVHLVHGGNLAASAEMRKVSDERIELDAEFVYQARRTGNVRQPDPLENEIGVSYYHRD